MSTGTNGLQRDLNLLKRRWWVFIPFFVFGVFVSYALGSFAGNANAVVVMRLDTVLHELFDGGDRGFRIFEAQAMTGDAEFEQKVKDAIGDPNFDYGRFTFTLNPVSVADGVSRGTMTVGISDPDKATAERYRTAFVDVYVREYSEPDGLFRQRYVKKKAEVAATFEKQYADAVAKLKPMADARGIPVDVLARPDDAQQTSLTDALNVEEASLQAQLAEVRASASPDAAKRAQLETAVKNLQAYRLSVSPASFDPEFRKLVDSARSAAELRADAYTRLENARGAAMSAQSDIELTYSLSGGLAGSMVGRVAVTLVVTLIFGLIAIYTLEWLSQIRTNLRGS